MAIQSEPSLSSTDQVILTRLTRMLGIADDLHPKLVAFRQSFIDSTSQIQSQRTQLAKCISLYKERSSLCTVHKSQIQRIQVRLDKILQKIEDLKFISSVELKNKMKLRNSSATSIR
jgi:hypothetical protein